MANRLWASEMMMGGVDAGQFSGPSSGHALQAENLNIGSKPNSGDDIDGNTDKVSDERPGEGGAVVTPRGRGRPKGSRNKPKASPSATRESPNMMKCHAFEIPSGTDMRQTLEIFARRWQLGLFILSGHGMVGNVTLRNPPAPAGVVTYAGPLQIISIGGAFSGTTENQEGTGITVSLVDVQSGAMVAGSVVGSLVAFGRVFLTAGTSADIQQEPPNFQPVQVQRRGLFRSSDWREAQQQINMMSEIRSHSANNFPNLPNLQP